MQLPQLPQFVQQGAVSSPRHTRTADAAANQITNTGFTYDSNGNLTNDGSNAYTWDRANRLLSMGGHTYAYDGLGQRIRQRGRIGHAGHARLRSALYMAALSAAHFNPVLIPFYERLHAKGKKNTVVLCAVARKLLCIAFALVKHERMFDPCYAQKTQIAA